VRLSLLLFAFVLGQAHAEELRGKVVGISGGDAITIATEDGKQHRVKLLGIAAPELSDEVGKRSYQRLSDLLYKNTISLDVRGRDSFRRALGKAELNGRDIALSQLEAGLAAHLPSELQTSDERKSYADAQDRARAEKLGVWREDFLLPPVEARPANVPVHCKEIRNTLQCDDGSTFTQIGSRVYGDDGSVYRKRGNTVYGPDGGTYRQMNGSTYGWDGSICRQRGTLVNCY
jgi:endonuclease YncB( thermonuclease family)